MKIAHKLAVTGATLALTVSGILASAPEAHAAYPPCKSVTWVRGRLVPTSWAGPTSCWLDITLRNQYLPGVRALQVRLGIAADGYYGPDTYRAVLAVQKQHGLHRDGVYGPQTAHALFGI